MPAVWLGRELGEPSQRYLCSLATSRVGRSKLRLESNLCLLARQRHKDGETLMPHDRLRESDVVVHDPVDIVVAYATGECVRCHSDKSPTGRAVVKGVKPPSERESTELRPPQRPSVCAATDWTPSHLLESASSTSARRSGVAFNVPRSRTRSVALATSSVTRGRHDRAQRCRRASLGERIPRSTGAVRRLALCVRLGMLRCVELSDWRRWWKQRGEDELRALLMSAWISLCEGRAARGGRVRHLHAAAGPEAP